MENNYVVYHLHSDYSILDSCTKYKEYINKAVDLGQTALGSTEHGNIYNWTLKKQACKEKGIKFLHGCEVYLTEKLKHNFDNENDFKVRDNYHTVLIAKNYDGVLELNRLISKSTDNEHFYYKPRITFDEFLNISDNIIKISACLASPLRRYLEFSNNNIIKNISSLSDYKKDKNIFDEKITEEIQKIENVFDKLCKKYDYYEIQYHNCESQIEYNKYLFELSKKYNKPLIAGTDTHNINAYKAECRNILQKAKDIQFSNEDEFDLTYKSYDELVKMFENQNSLPMDIVLTAIDNTNVMADSVEDFELDSSIKYPHLYDNDEEVYIKRIYDMFKEKVDKGVIAKEHVAKYEENIKEEIRVFKQVDMMGFMLSMSDICIWARNNGRPIGFSRGSCGGSCVAYITDITDIDPVKWNLVFSRFCNEYRKEIGDVDIDIYKDDRPYVYDYIINRVGKEKTALVLALGTISDKGTIDAIGKALEYPLPKVKEIKQEYGADAKKCREKYPQIFYYFDGMLNTIISQSQHPAGIIASPITLDDNYGVFCGSDNQIIMSLDMDAVHEVGLAKYDILGLRNVGIIKKTYEYIGKSFPKSYEIDWDDQLVWKSIKDNNIGVFQFEGDFAFRILKNFDTKSIDDMSLVTAMIRPSGASYRDRLCRHEVNHNPSEIIDNLLKDNFGFLVYQEDVIAFLQNICGLSGGEADNVRRAIGRKDSERLQKALPQILEGYCEKSEKSREVAEEEAKEFLKIIENASSYMFGKNHSFAYCLIGYLCGYLRYYYPIEFLTAFFNCSESEEDFANGEALAKFLKVKINMPKFRYSKSEYYFNKETNCIYKGVTSIKFLNSSVAEELYSLKNNSYDTFLDLLYDISEKTNLKTNQLDILIKLDFFEEFGNSKFLTKVNSMFTFFKNGNAKSMKKEKLMSEKIIYDIVSRHSKESPTQFSNLNTKLIMEEIYDLLFYSSIKDYDMRYKIEQHLKYLGYIGIITNKEEDRFKIIITDIKSCVSKFDKDKGSTWAVNVTGQSMGNGKNNSFTILYPKFVKNKFSIYDMIKIKKTEKNKKGYWYVNDYVVIPTT